MRDRMDPSEIDDILSEAGARPLAKRGQRQGNQGTEPASHKCDSLTPSPIHNNTPNTNPLPLDNTPPNENIHAEGEELLTDSNTSPDSQLNVPYVEGDNLIDFKLDADEPSLDVNQEKNEDVVYLDGSGGGGVTPYEPDGELRESAADGPAALPPDLGERERAGVNGTSTDSKGSTDSNIKVRPKRRASGGRKPAIKNETKPALENGVGLLEEKNLSLSGRVQVDAGMYNRMWDAWCEKQSIAHVAKVAGVAESTAKRYIDGTGCPEAGMVPIKKRWLRVQARVQAEEELSLIKFRREQMGIVSDAISAAAGELVLMKKDVEQRIEEMKNANPDELPRASTSLDKLTQSIDRMVRLGERLLGGPDNINENRDGSERYETWTVEELIEYSTTGKVPDHDRSDVMIISPDGKGE